MDYWEDRIYRDNPQGYERILNAIDEYKTGNLNIHKLMDVMINNGVHEEEAEAFIHLLDES